MKLVLTVSEGNPPMFFSCGGKYCELHQSILDAPEGKWLVVTGFDTREEVVRTQSALNSGAGNGLRGKLVKSGMKLVTRQYIRENKMELWLYKTGAQQP